MIRKHFNEFLALAFTTSTTDTADRSALVVVGYYVFGVAAAFAVVAAAWTLIGVMSIAGAGAIPGAQLAASVLASVTLASALVAMGGATMIPIKAIYGYVLAGGSE